MTTCTSKSDIKTNIFYIYFHINKQTQQIFYVGKGCGKRAYVKSHRNMYWQRVVSKYGYTIQIVENGLSESESALREVYWISKIGRKDLGMGTLINFTNGGEGTVGRIATEKTRKAVGLSNQLRPKSVVQKNIVGSMFRGKFGAQHNRSKRVVCIETGLEYGSMSEASRKLNISISAVSLSVNDGLSVFGLNFKLAI